MGGKARKRVKLSFDKNVNNWGTLGWKKVKRRAKTMGGEGGNWSSEKRKGERELKPRESLIMNRGKNSRVTIPQRTEN